MTQTCRCRTPCPWLCAAHDGLPQQQHGRAARRRAEGCRWASQVEVFVQRERPLLLGQQRVVASAQYLVAGSRGGWAQVGGSQQGRQHQRCGLCNACVHVAACVAPLQPCACRSQVCDEGVLAAVQQARGGQALVGAREEGGVGGAAGKGQVVIPHADAQRSAAGGRDCSRRHPAECVSCHAELEDARPASDKRSTRLCRRRPRAQTQGLPQLSSNSA